MSPIADHEKTVDRFRNVLARKRGITEKKMIGGICFLANGNMIGGITGNGDLMIRVGRDGYEDALAQKHARQMDFTGKVLRGFVFVDRAGFAREASLRKWVERGLAYARSLPAK